MDTLLCARFVWQDMPCIGDQSKRAVETRDAEIYKNTHNKWSKDSFLGGTDCSIPQEWKDNYYKEWSEIINTLKVFQCICVWVPFNFSLCGDILDVHHYPMPAMNAFEAKMINVIGEYGGLGLVIPDHTWQKDKNWGYGRTCADAEELVQTYHKFAEMLKGFISMGCSAAVYTQTTDVEVEVNGLMTYDRLLKVDPAVIREINQSVINFPME